jgi:predicted amidohydrolase
MTLSVACIQCQIKSDKKSCYLEIENLLQDHLQESKACDLYCLPERWVLFYNDYKKNIQEERGEDYRFIKNLAKSYGINIISGAIWEKRKNHHKPYITSYFIDNNGEEIGRQDKMHLYLNERRKFMSGTQLNIFDHSNLAFSILICFDMAFFETPRLAVENGSSILFSPTMIREEGMTNWEIYLKARALENRIPIIACNTLGKFPNRLFTGKSKILSFEYGHITPSRLKIKEAPENARFILQDDIDLEFPKKLRDIRLNEIIPKLSIKVNKITF